MIVYFLRHASAGQGLTDPKKDEKRPLDETGVLQARYVGRSLMAIDAAIDVIISSPLKRALQTATIVANELGFEQKIEIDAAMRPEATYTSFQSMLRKHAGADAIMVVGHNPSMEDFLSRMIGRQGRAASVQFKKGAIAKIEVRRAEGTLLWSVTPKVLAALQGATKSSRPNTSRK